jgi:hypothetical protein
MNAPSIPAGVTSSIGYTPCNRSSKSQYTGVNASRFSARRIARGLLVQERSGAALKPSAITKAGINSAPAG